MQFNMKMLIAGMASFTWIFCIHAEVISGTVPPINTATVSNVGTGISMGEGTSGTVLCKIKVDNNYENAFDLKVVFANKGVLKRSSASGDTVGAAEGSGKTLALTNIRLIPTGIGTLGSGAQVPSVSAYSLGNDSGSFIWNADWNGSVAVKQATSTVGYEVTLVADLPSSTALLQGSYTETITVFITVGDQVETIAS